MHAKGLYNAYFLVFFAACREIRQNTKVEIHLEQYEEKKDDAARGNSEIDCNISNFILSFGCMQGSGVKANTQYV